MITILSGGTGTPKLLEGFEPGTCGVVVNTAEDCYVSGLYVSPDVDTVVYALAGIVDDTKWYGQKNDTYHCYEMMVSLGYEELLKIGDRDRGLKLYRTLLMSEGVPLSEVTERICEALHVETPVFPMSNDKVTTKIVTDKGEMSFHEFWVARKADVTVRDVIFQGVEKVHPVKKALTFMKESKFVLIGPSNPITSIGPIMAMKDYREILREKNVVSISPVVGEKPFSGPAGVLMRGLGVKTNCVGVAELYKDFLDVFIIHETDGQYKKEIEDMGISVHLRDIFLDSYEKKRELAKSVERMM